LRIIRCVLRVLRVVQWDHSRSRRSHRGAH